MSSDRANSNRPLKPTLASTRTTAPRTPLTPRIAGSATSTPAASTTSSTTPRPTPRLPNRTPAKDAVVGSGNVTPRSSARKSRVGGTSPGQEDIGIEAAAAGRRVVGDAHGRGSGISSLSLPRARLSRPNSVISDNGSKGLNSPLVMRSPALVESTESIESRFFHASEAAKKEPAPKKPELKKTPTFFYADGQQDESTGPTSPVLSAINDQRPSGPWIKPEVQQSLPAKSPPMLSPAASTASTSYFPPTLTNRLRSPSPSKENIHFSYRKGVSQIFGTRPTSTPAPPDTQPERISEENRRPSHGLLHRKSTSLSSITSSSQPRRRSNTALDVAGSPLNHFFEHAAATPFAKTASPQTDLPSIETLASHALVGSPSELALSPTKSVSQLAADARRERKVLDLEISNSSLLAINTSLEREVRRQKAELKRFRRLSRAGRLLRSSEGLGILGEDDEDADSSGLLSGFGDDGTSDSEDEDSLVSGSEPLSPTSQNNKQQERLAKDEKRLQVDLERHKELLVQSQAMNQSLKRCMCATEEMIREGKRALEYHVRVSDVKLGGRILTGFEADDGEADDIEIAGELDWHSGGDRDSGVEVETLNAGHFGEATHTSERPGRPPDDVS